MDRATLIARKQALRQQIERAQRQLEALRQSQPANRRRIVALEREMERWMGEEYSLRVTIDQQRIG
jgi:prefoldin subunit 5